MPPVTPHPIAEGPYHFNAWDPLAPAGTYPPHMVFRQAAGEDPVLAAEMETPWTLAYNLASRSRIHGLGDAGVSFLNTGNAQAADGAGFAGAAVLALDTRNAENLHARWTAGTVTPNSRVYGLRLQARVGASGPFGDVTDTHGAPYEYLRNGASGHQQVFGPVRLPAELEGHPYVELRWKYHHVSGESGPRAELRLDGIRVFAADGFQAWRARTYPDPEDFADDLVSGPTADPGSLGVPNLARYAFGVEGGGDPRARLPVLRRGNGQFHMEFPMAPLAPDVAYLLQASTDMLDWETLLFDSRISSMDVDAEDLATVVLDAADGPLFVRLRLLLVP